jgi:hypothetical protein
MALIGPELFGGSNQYHSLAIPDENGALARRYEDRASFTVIDVEIGGDVEDEEVAIFAVVDVVLLLLNRVDFLHLEGTTLVDEAVVVGVVLLLHCLGLQHVCLEDGLLLDDHGRLLDQW